MTNTAYVSNALPLDSCYNALMAESPNGNNALHFECSGSGPDVLLIHGWASSNRMWLRLMQSAQEYARFWAVDLAGFGASPAPADVVLNLHQHTALLAHFCDHYAIRPRAVVGHSMGGTLALMLALNRPDLMERLVLIAPVVTGRFSFFNLHVNHLVASRLGHHAITHSRILWRSVQKGIFTPFLTVSLHALHQKEVAQRIVHDFRRASWQAAAHSLESIAHNNLEPYLSQIEHPALVLIGSRDYTVSPQEGRLLARCLPNARLVEWHDVRHQPPDERPDDFVSAVCEFLSVKLDSIASAVPRATMPDHR